MKGARGSDYMVNMPPKTRGYVHPGDQPIDWRAALLGDEVHVTYEHYETAER